MNKEVWQPSLSSPPTFRTFSPDSPRPASSFLTSSRDEPHDLPRLYSFNYAKRVKNSEGNQSPDSFTSLPRILNKQNHVKAFYSIGRSPARLFSLGRNRIRSAKCSHRYQLRPAGGCVYRSCERCYRCNSYRSISVSERYNQRRHHGHRR